MILTFTVKPWTTTSYVHPNVKALELYAEETLEGYLQDEGYDGDIYWKKLGNGHRHAYINYGNEEQQLIAKIGAR